jgi:T5SS/PEP-CTERM-associated repeat protein/autotransporter-associated beta strand protein
MSFSLSCICPKAIRRASWVRFVALGLGMLAAIATVTTAPVARAADTAWTGATGSAWGTAGNWSAGVPTAADNAQFLSGYPNATISLSGSNVANQVQVWAGSTYTLTSSAPATLAFSDQLYMFSDPTASALTVSGSLAVSGPNGAIGTGANDVGGTLTVAGNASVGIANTFYVGYDGINNALRVETGGAFTANTLSVGTLVTAQTNSVILAGGAVTASNGLIVGTSGRANSVTGSSGSITVQGAVGTEIGVNADSFNNLVQLTGATFSSTSSLIVGRAGTANYFVVENGSVATTGQARLGLDGGSDANRATVSGAGSQWTANGTVRVGDAGNSNALKIENGGSMTVAGVGRNLWIGYSGSSAGNYVKVDGAGSVLNVTDLGSEVVVSGSTMGSSNQLILSNSGSANVNSVQVGPGGAVIVGGDPTVSAGPGFLKSTATIIGNDGGLGQGGGVIAFTHNAASYQFPNVMSGSLSVLVYGTGTTTITGSNTYTGTTVIQAGGLALGPSASIASSSQIAVGPLGVYDVSAVSGGYELAAGQSLFGVGTVIGPATGVVGSVVAPGGLEDDVGTLTVLGGLTLLGDLKIDIDGATIDLLDGSAGGLALGGTVTFNEMSAPVGDLVFAKYATLSGVFSSFSGIPSGYAIDYNYLGGNQIALVGAVPEIDPASAGSVLALVGGALGMLERRRRRQA